MKRASISLSAIATTDNLALAAWKAARGKRLRPDVVRFFSDLDHSLAQLAQDILAGRVPYGEYRAFTIHDPKTRLIHAACFEDRVLHHAIMSLAEPVFERALVPTTFACRPKRGVHKAVSHVQQNLRRFPWFGKIDIDAYFSSIDQARLKGLLAKRFKGEGFLALVGRIIDSYAVRRSKGLPIGSLTSQHFANYYLDGADRFLLAHPLVRAHVRYMDDVIWWGADKDAVTQVVGELRDYLDDQRSLHIKPAFQINRSARGVTYCGHRVLPGTIRLTPRKKMRYRLLHEQWECAWRDGRIDSVALQRGYDAVHAITLHCDSLSWRKRNLALHPSRYVDASTLVGRVPPASGVAGAMAGETRPTKGSRYSDA